MTEILILGGVILICLFSVGVITFVAGLITDMIREHKEDKYY